MANIHGIASAGESLVRYLNLCFARQQPVPTATTNAVLVRTEDFDTVNSAVIVAPALSVYLYRVDYNKTMRAAWAGVASQDGRSHLPLDLHFLLTPWAENANYEYRILGRVLECLEDTPILSGPLLDSLGNWSTQDALQICLESLSTEDVMRTFDSLPLDYKLSIPYVVRIVRIDGRLDTSDAPVTTLVTAGKPDTEYE
jgi:hypothetical protein